MNAELAVLGMRVGTRRHKEDTVRVRGEEYPGMGSMAKWEKRLWGYARTAWGWELAEETNMGSKGED